MSGRLILQQSVPVKSIIIIALITIVLFSISGAIPMPLLLSGRFTWGEVGFGFLIIAINVSAFWIINLLLLYYCNKYFSFKHQWVRYIISIILCGLVVLVLMHFVKMIRSKYNLDWRPPLRPFIRDEHHGFPGSRQMPFERRYNPFLFDLIRTLPVQAMNIIILILLEIILLRDRKNRMEKENDMLRMANLEAKQSLLKQQLQPHFLFNSLTTVKALIKKDPEKADKYVDMLSGLLRYSVYSNNHYTVSIEEELDYVRTYLEMQKIRFGDSLTYSFNIPQQLLNKIVPVYSIQLLVENALKHNSFTQNAPLDVTVSGIIANDSIVVENKLQHKEQVQYEITEGVGLKNLEERFLLLGGTPPVIKQTGHVFSVSLKTLGYANSNH